MAASRAGALLLAVIPKGDKGAIARFLDRFVAKDTRIMSDDDRAIAKAAKAFAGHRTVIRSQEEFARGEVHSNTVEGLASQLKRAQHALPLQGKVYPLWADDNDHCSKRGYHRDAD